MQQIIFYKINKHFIQICPDSKKFTGIFILSEDYKHWKTGQLIEAKNITKSFNQQLDGKYYTTFIGNDYIFLKQVSVVKFLYYKLFPLNIDDYVKSIILDFRHHQKEKLLIEFTSNESCLDSRMQTLCDYTFSEQYSLWVYHPHLSAFTCASSSFTQPGIIIPDDVECSLTKTIELSTNSFDSREISRTSIYGGDLLKLGMKFVNRLIIKYGDSSVAIASFYSKNALFEFDKKLYQRLSQIIKSKLINELEDSHEKFEVFSKKIDLDLGQQTYQEYSKKFLQTLCNHFKYESADISVITENKFNSISHFGELAQNTDFTNILDELTTDELQTCVLSPMDAIYDGKPRCSFPDYKIRSITLNPFIIGDLTFCLITINKIGHNQPTLPSSIDLDLLQRATEHFAFATDVFVTYEKLDSKNRTQQNFSKVWMHELRTPINTFTLTPDIIKHRLKRLKLGNEDIRKLLDQLDDIKMFGSRLKLLTDTFDFKEMLKSKQIITLSVLKDIVFPIYSISNNFAKTQYNLVIDLDHHSFKGVQLRSDVRLLNMVLNAIVDNALKYSLSDSEFIKISGEFLIPKFYTIKVSNRGYPIEHDELNSVFEELQRGKNVTSQKIHGTGIGLFIAKKVMNALDGDVELTSNTKSKIEFSIHIPINEKNDEQ